MATIKDIASKVGVSIATVSRVLNGNYYVSPDITQKVLDAVEELNYYPNIAARSLKNDSTKTIGIVVSDISNVYFTTISKAVEDIVSQQEYNIIVCSTEDKADRELSYLKMLMSQKIDGLILNTTGLNNDFVVKISKIVPIVLLDRKIESSGFIGDYISTDNMESAFMLTTLLLENGHRKIGVVNGTMHLNNAKDRFEGFKTAMSKYNIEASNDYYFSYKGDFSIESGYRAMEKFMSLEDKPTAIVTMNNMSGIGVLRYLREMKIDIPGTISLVVYGKIGNHEILYVEPTTIAPDPKVIGKKLSSLLFARMADKSKENQSILYIPQFISGNTVKKMN